MNKAIGLLGGTFNPIHYGHLLLAEEARVQYNLDQILFIPNHLPPHRITHISDLIDSDKRYIMAILATTSNPYFQVSPIELKRQGVSYTYDTVLSLKKENPSASYFFICGADALINHTWYQFEKLMEMLEGILLAPRSGETPEMARNKIATTMPQVVQKLMTIEMSPVEISATNIREKIRRGESIRYLVPENVEKYIEHYKLYLEVFKR